MIHQLLATLDVTKHPQTDRQTERVNQELEQYLRMYINHHQDDWVNWISMAEFVHNNRTHSATGTSPFYITSGFHPNWGTTVTSQGLNESLTDFIRRMEKSWEDAKAKLDRTKRLMKDQYDTHRWTAIKYKPGDIVWLNASNIPSQRPSKKLNHKYLGPYKVVKKIGASAYQLSSQGQSTRHATFNEQCLKPFRKGIYPSQTAELLATANNQPTVSPIDCRSQLKKIRKIEYGWY